MPLEGVQVPSRQMTMTERNISEKPSRCHVSLNLVNEWRNGHTVDGAESSDESERVAVSNEKAKWIAPLRRGEVVRPPV